MPVTASSETDPVTESGDVRVRVRAAGSGSVTPIRPGLTPGSAHVRAIQDKPSKVKDDRPGKIRDVVSPHVEGVKASPELAWLTRQLPETLEQVATTLIPKGVRNPITWLGTFAARLFKLGVHFTAYTACAATGTDKRSAASLALAVLTIAITLAATALAGH